MLKIELNRKNEWKKVSDVLNASKQVYQYKLNRLYKKTMTIQKNKNRRLEMEKETHVKVKDQPSGSDSQIVSIIANDGKICSFLN